MKNLLIFPLLLLAIPAFACIDFTGHYKCPDHTIKVTQTNCDWMRTVTRDKHGFVRDTTVKTDGFFHQNGSSLFMAEHRGSEYFFNLTMATPNGARTDRAIVTKNSDGELVVQTFFAANEWNMPVINQYVCKLD